MHPLRRWPTSPSIHSHWSDSASIRPSFPIHALAKPLSKFMYHRQAAGIIAENSESALSPEVVEVLATYLTFKDIFPSTRMLVLDHLGSRVLSSKQDAQVVANSNVLGSLPEILRLDTSSPHILRSTCTLVGHLAQREELRAIMFGLELHPQLIPLANHRDFEVQKAAVSALNGLDVVEPLLHYFLSSNSFPMQMTILNILELRARKDEQHARLIVECDTTLRNCISKSLRSANRDILRLVCLLLLNISEYKTLLIALSSAMATHFNHLEEYLSEDDFLKEDLARKVRNLKDSLECWQNERLQSRTATSRRLPLWMFLGPVAY
ncbi:hypothetical protein C8F04DRAFT_1112719 [Mycena alexandri]|uniref:Uncharacterized protein n=1 Tax=Mycena alexandri TaxID=1745969 RepID=A0AAD6X023_9AGAR|nr:hypothetical protein C8F04DRAFT_1112719 [Mycena alexandri]